MIKNEFELYQKVAGIDPENRMMGLAPAPPIRMEQFAPDGWRWEITGGVMALWTFHGSEGALAYQHQMLKAFESQNTRGFLYPLPLSDGRTYAQLGERQWFYFTSLPPPGRVSFGNLKDLESVVELLVDFRKACERGGIWCCLPERKTTSNLLHRFQAILEHLKVFAALGKHRLRPTWFDRIFLQRLPEAESQAIEAIRYLETTRYFELWERLTGQDLILNKLVRSNLRLTPKREAVCLRVHDFSWDPPIIDLANLLVKTGRSAHWTPKWFSGVTGKYRESFSISDTEWEVIKAFLLFPWSFYRLASRYYYNRTEWSHETFITKLERLWDDEPNRRQFLDELLKKGGLI
ncbi:MAG TPA: hypothetical protein VF531_07325 [Bacillota bacterium]